MYTQCPECRTAFRVTASILQQAAGKVRCGGCGISFSALAHLSEEMPPLAGPAGSTATDAADALHKRELLDTLNELTGPQEVRIEDTGVEWRVLDDDADEPDQEEAAVTEEIDDDEQPAGAGTATDDAEIGDSPDVGGRDAAAKAPTVFTEEMRFDDNTPLPEDFADPVTPVAVVPDVPHRRDSDHGQSDDFDEPQADLALGEPDDWMDLLDEVDEHTNGGIPLDVEEELAAIHSELSSGRAEPANDSGEDMAPEAEPTDAADLAALSDLVPTATALELQGEDDDQEADEAAAEVTLAEPAPIDSPAFAAQPPDAPDDGLNDELDDAPEPVESTGEFESQIAKARAELARALDSGDEAAESQAGEVADPAPADGEEMADSGLQPEAEPTPPADLPEEAAQQAEASGDEAGSPPPDTPTRESDYVVPPPTPEEMTINEEIDQDLLAASQITDFVTTVAEVPEAMFDENSPGVETIVMEGEFVRGSFEQERRAAAGEAGAELLDDGDLRDSYSIDRGKLRGGRRKGDPPGFGVIGGVLLLFLLLLGQMIHASRESLSTYGAFNQSLGNVYRALGRPVTPQWNVKGWRFEATRGATDYNEEVLTIFSRIANRAGEPLPYPLVHVSLTDRWEEIIGSRILEPNEYLAGDLDPSKPVAPGDGFGAVISIENPSEDATGFKLNVCYRVSPARVRCATEDFKD